MESDNNELSFIDILKTIYKNKWHVAIITVIITILGFLMLKCVYNKSKEEYEVVVEYNFVGIDKGVYPDGSPFNYQECISLINLNETKNSSLDFKNIDTETMYEKDYIKIEKVYNSEEKSVVCKFNVKRRCFKNEKQAKSFMKKLVLIPYDTAGKKINSMVFDADLNQSKDAKLYRSQIMSLEKQYDFITNGYLNLIELFGDLNIIEENKQAYTLSSKMNEMIEHFNLYSFSSLLTKMINNGYLKSEEAKEILTNQYNDYNNQLIILTKKIDDMKNAIDSLSENVGTALDTSTTLYFDMIDERSNLNNEIEEIKKQLDISCFDTEDFNLELSKITEKLESDTVDYTNTFIKIYNERNNAFFSSNSIIVSTGGINIYLGTLISFVLGFILSATAINFVKWIKKSTEVPCN